MSARLAVAWVLAAVLAGFHVEPVVAQADVHARAVARASCQTGKQSETVINATAAVARDADDLVPRMRLADALVDQGCYQEAVSVLEAGQQTHPRNSELSAKLRDVRSLVTEQTYIEGLTQAAEGAKFQRNQLRCTKLADVTACDDALKFKPDDAQLLAAKHDALAKRTALAATETPQAFAAQQAAGQPAIARSTTAQPAVAQAERPNGPDTVAASGPPRPKLKRTPASVSGSTATPSTAAPVATVAAIEPAPEPKTYSNDAPAGRSN